MRAEIFSNRKSGTGVAWAFERFHAYVNGIKFVVETDHKPLEVICGPQTRPCARIERWVLRLQPNYFSVVHRPGKGKIADPLSRLFIEKLSLTTTIDLQKNMSDICSKCDTNSFNNS